MPGKILGLDISEDAVAAVQVLSGVKGYQVTACAQVTIEREEGRQGALRALLEQMDLKSDTCLAALPAEYASYRNLQMPFRENKKIRQTLPFEMETVVPFPIENLVVDFTVVERKEESTILGVSVSKDYMAQFLTDLQAHGIDPDVVDIRCVPTVAWLLKQEETPEQGLFLEIGGQRDLMILFLNRQIGLIRSLVPDGRVPGNGPPNPSPEEPDSSASEQIEYRLRSFCAQVENTIHAFSWQMKREIRPERVYFTGPGALYPGTGNLLEGSLGIPAEQTNLRGHKRVRLESHVARVWNPALMDNALALALREDRPPRGFNLRRGTFEVQRHYSALKAWIRRAALVLSLILCLLVLDLGTDYYVLRKRYTTLDRNIEQVFRKTFPETKRIVDPVQQARVKVREMKKSTVAMPGFKVERGVLPILREISQRVAKPLDIHVTRLVIDPEAVRISGDTDTFNTVDTIKNGLEPSAFFSAVTITSANLDRTGKRVQFEIRLQRAE